LEGSVGDFDVEIKILHNICGVISSGTVWGGGYARVRGAYPLPPPDNPLLATE